VKGHSVIEGEGKRMEKDLRGFLDLLKIKMPEEYLEIKDEIDIHHDTTAWVEILEQGGRDPVFFFRKVKGFSQPIVSNLFGSKKVMALALETSLESFLDVYKERQKNPIPPHSVSSGPVREIVLEGDHVDLSILPIPFHHEGDVAPYITGGIVTVRDPETRKVNCSFHRLMVAGRNRLRTHIAPGRHLDNILRQHENRNASVPCAVFIGSHPALGLGATAMVQRGTDEIEVMGGMLGEPIPLLNGILVDCVYPANAEIVLEAEILSNVREEEGPFAEFTGYAAGLRKRPVLIVKTLCMRKDAIYHDLIAGANEHLLPASVARETYFLDLARSVSPRVQSVSLPLSGCGRFHCYVSLDKGNEGEVNQIGMTLLGADSMLKHVVVVDRDIDVFNEREVLWAIATRTQADRDMTVIPNCLGSDLDPSTHFSPDHEGLTAKMIIDATAKPGLHFGAYSRRNRIPGEIEKKVREKIFAGKV
jgi:2,5-furandicarboxylate decarboxylase 1